MDFSINITTALVSVGASTTLAYLLMKTFFVEKIKSSIKNDYDTRLEKLKGELTTNNTILNSFLTSQNHGAQQFQSERIEAIKRFWVQYLKVKNTLSSFTTWDEALTEEEFSSLYSKEWKGNHFVQESFEKIEWNLFLEISNSLDEVEAIRPFLSEKLWFQFFFLKQFSGRVLYLYKTGVENKKIQHWKKDAALLEMVGENLTGEEFRHIQTIRMNSIKTVQSFVEQKMLLDISDILTGNIGVEDSFKSALKLVELTKSNF